MQAAPQDSGCSVSSLLRTALLGGLVAISALGRTGRAKYCIIEILPATARILGLTGVLLSDNFMRHRSLS